MKNFPQAPFRAFIMSSFRTSMKTPFKGLKKIPIALTGSRYRFASECLQIPLSGVVIDPIRGIFKYLLQDPLQIIYKTPANIFLGFSREYVSMELRSTKDPLQRVYKDPLHCDLKIPFRELIMIFVRVNPFRVSINAPVRTSINTPSGRLETIPLV